MKISIMRAIAFTTLGVAPLAVASTPAPQASSSTFTTGERNVLAALKLPKVTSAPATPSASSPEAGVADGFDGARQAIVAGRLEEAIQLAEKANAAAPTEREPLEFLVAAYDALGDETKAKVVYKKIGALPKAQPAPTENKPPELVDARPGQLLFVGATRLKVRAKPDRASRPVIELLINTPVKVTQVQGDWVQVEPTSKVFFWSTGYAHRAFLTASRLKPDELVAQADSLEKAQQLVDATRLLERAMALKPMDRKVAERLTRVATGARLYPAVVDGAIRWSGIKTKPPKEHCPACPEGPAILAKNVIDFSGIQEKLDLAEADDEYAVSCTRSGSFRAGPYTGRDLYTCKESYPYKTDGPSDTTHLRLAIGDGKATLLTLNSDPGLDERLKSAVTKRFKFNVDEDWFVHDLRPYPVLFEDHLVRVRHAYSSTSIPSGTELRPLFRHKLLRDVSVIHGERNENGSLVVKQPDGLVFFYLYTRKFTDQEVRWSGKRAAKEYVSQVWTCAVARSDVLNGVAAAGVKEGDMEQTGTIGEGGVPVFALKSNKHPALRRVHDRCRKLVELGAQDTCSLDASLPLYYFRDPFGRLMELRNAALAPPSACEPIIYLYPPADTAVRVQLDAQVQQLKSIPPHGVEGWSVLAKPDGSLVAQDTGITHPYLFWEGHSLLLQRPAQGFVVARDEVDGFLRRTLPQLGLQGAEIDAFIHAWVEILTEAPYCFIGFHDPSVTDKLFPLRIEPMPDVTIRILMDYELLHQPRPAEAPQWGPPPQRSGFTVVEWGGIRR